MKLIAPIYNSPNPTEGTFSNVVIEETSFQIQRKENYLKIDFQMYLRDKPEVVLVNQLSLAFQGMNADLVSSNRKATFCFNTDPTVIFGLIDYLQANSGAFPTNYTMVDWGFPSYEDALNYLTGGTFASPEINPVNQFVKDWIKNTVIMKGELIGKQFEFVV